MDMAELSQPLLALLFFYYVAASLFFLSDAGSLSFAFPPKKNITVESDAYFQTDEIIQLTPNQVSGDLGHKVGWAAYEPIPLWHSSSRALANFSTHFQFIIGHGNDIKHGFGDGLAFFLVPTDSKPTSQAYGSGLGLFNEKTNKPSSYQVVAVEFDTYNNVWDPDDNHVGIDVNSVVSMVNVSLSPESGGFRPPEDDLKSQSYWEAWVDYDAGVMQLKVFLLYNPSANVNNISKPQSPILWYDIDLRDYLPEYIKVGLSAATGDSTETHTVSAWNFSCEYLWETSTAAPPTNAPDGDNAPPPSNASDGENAAPPNNGSDGESPSIVGPEKTRWNNNSVIVILISVIAIVLAVCGFVFLGWWWYFRKSKRGGEASEENDVELDECFAQGPRKFSYAELSAATTNFSEDQKLGQGGFGGVYRGILPLTNEVVAVKRISEGSNQGKKEYISEVTIISQLRHRNLVQLLGWCHKKGELLLVYEFLPNGSLDKYLFGEGKGHLDWNRRYIIACGIASALVYLHEEYHQRVVHRDVKASNVMLDSNFNAKLGDFGLARLLDGDKAASDTTVVAGTLGYLAPEYVITGKASPETDVFSFGAVTLEIACGRPPVDRTLNEHNCRLVEWVWGLYGQGKLLDAADEKLCGNFSGKEMERLMLVGLLCSHPDPKTRPTMKQVIMILKLEAELPYVPLDLPVPVYSKLPRSDLTLSSTSMTLNSSAISGVSSSSSSSAVNESMYSSSTASSSSEKTSRPLLPSKMASLGEADH